MHACNRGLSILVSVSRGEKGSALTCVDTVLAIHRIEPLTDPYIFQAFQDETRFAINHIYS